MLFFSLYMMKILDENIKILRYNKDIRLSTINVFLLKLIIADDFNFNLTSN